MSSDRTSFADMAVELRLLCQREAMGLEQIEVLALSDPAILRALPNFRESVAVLAEAAQLLRSLVPLESRVRSLLLITGSERPGLRRPLRPRGEAAALPAPIRLPAEARS